MRVLVTGATSLIGGRTVESLLARGDDVTTLQRHPSGLHAHDVVGSVTDRDAVARACEGQEAVIHAAARVAATGRWDEFERTNVAGTALMIEEARRHGVRAFVQVSSPAVAHAGHSLVGAGAEPADPRVTRGHYATSKALGENLALGASDDAMPVVAIRPHLVWGPGDTQLVGRLVERARRGQLAVVGSGTALVDSTYVDNAASALLAAIDRARDLAGRALVVSNGEPRTVQELIARVLGAAGVAAEPRHVPKKVALATGSLIERVWFYAHRTDDPPMTRFLAEQLGTAHWFDQRGTRSALRWEPTVSLAEGFAKLTEWFGSEPPGGDRRTEGAPGDATDDPGCTARGTHVAISASHREADPGGGR